MCQPDDFPPYPAATDTPEAARDDGVCSYNVGPREGPYIRCGRPIIAEWRLPADWVSACTRHDRTIAQALDMLAGGIGRQAAERVEVTR